MDFILTPCFIFAVVNLLYNSVFHKLFKLLGEHSTNMWLIHSFFCYRYFQWLVFKPRLSILILIWLVMLSLESSYFINYLHKCGSKGIIKYITPHNQKNTTKKRKKLHSCRIVECSLKTNKEAFHENNIITRNISKRKKQRNR